MEISMTPNRAIVVLLICGCTSCGCDTGPRVDQSVQHLADMNKAFETLGNQGHLPPHPADGEMVGQSWMTDILPHIGESSLYTSVDRTQAWDDEKNREPFSTDVAMFLSPAIDATKVNGHSPAHYAGNIHVQKPTGGIRYRDMTDGSGNLILAGEVSAGFRPWGSPDNLRDPGLGFGDAPDKFGSPYPEVAVLIGDGSVRPLSKDVAPEILRALSTPGGGEDMEEIMQRFGKK